MFKQERSAAHEEEDNDEEKEKDKEKEEKDKEEVGLAETSVFCPSWPRTQPLQSLAVAAVTSRAVISFPGNPGVPPVKRSPRVDRSAADITKPTPIRCRPSVSLSARVYDWSSLCVPVL